MKKIVPLKKELSFKNHLSEITAIALDHELTLEDRSVKGTLTVSGNYKINDTSVNTEEFTYSIPVDIEISENYDVSSLSIDIDDFYYEIINNSSLSVSIDICLDNLKEAELPRMKEEIIVEELIETEQLNEILEEKIDENKDFKEDLKRINTDDVKSLFSSFDESTETYATYKICIVKEADTIESILMKYSISREVLEQYNDLTDLKIGDKLIIPSVFNEKN